MFKATLATAAKAAAVTVAVAALSLTATGTASANSFSGVDVEQGTISYNDGKDRFCVRAYNDARGKDIMVKLTPLDASRGPVKWVNDSNHEREAHCASLATAYEDTRYKADVWIWKGGNWRHQLTKYFWS